MSSEEDHAEPHQEAKERHASFAAPSEERPHHQPHDDQGQKTQSKPTSRQSRRQSVSDALPEAVTENNDDKPLRTSTSFRGRPAKRAEETISGTEEGRLPEDADSRRGGKKYIVSPPSIVQALPEKGFSEKSNSATTTANGGGDGGGDGTVSSLLVVDHHRPSLAPQEETTTDTFADDDDDEEKEEKSKTEEEEEHQQRQEEQEQEQPKEEQHEQEQKPPSSSSAAAEGEKQRTTPSPAGSRKSRSPPSPPGRSSPAQQQRTYMMRQEALPSDQQYWSSSNCNPWQRQQQQVGQIQRFDGQVNDTNNNNELAPAHGGDDNVVPPQSHKKKKKKVTLTYPEATESSAHFQQRQEEQQHHLYAAGPSSYEHPPSSSSSGQQHQTKLPGGGVVGAVDVSSCHRPLRGARLPPGLARSNNRFKQQLLQIHQQQQELEANEHDPLMSSTGRVEQKQREESPLGNFVHLPAITRPAGIANKVRNSDARRKMPDVVHVDEDVRPPLPEASRAREQGDGGAHVDASSPVHAADALETKAVELLVRHGAGSPVHGPSAGDGVDEKNGSGRLCIVSPDKRSFVTASFVDHDLQEGGGGGGTTSTAMTTPPLSSSLTSAVVLHHSHSHKLRAEGMKQTPSSIPPCVAPVAEEARTNHVVVYESYDRDFAERRLKNLATKGKAVLSTRNPLGSSRLYHAKPKDPDGFCSTEAAIVQLAKERDARGRGSDMKSIGSLMSIAGSHRALAESSSGQLRNVARSARPVVPRGMPADHAPYTTRSAYAAAPDADAKSWMRQRDVGGMLQRAKTDHEEQLMTEAKNQRQLVLLEEQQALDENDQQQQRGGKGAAAVLTSSLSSLSASSSSPSPLHDQGQLVEVRVPSAVGSGSPGRERVIGFQLVQQHSPIRGGGGGGRNNNNPTTAPFFSLTPRLNQQTTVSDANYVKAHLPSAPSDAPKRFSDLMQARMARAAQEAVRLTVSHSTKR